ncbi:MAG: UPF0175 family protein [Candidatus Nanoarchaeia archaeon]|nr:UPF0175 family protein [Candidatus Nanoarchaeia archaeon]
MSSTTISFTVPKEIKLKLDAVTHIGYYDSVSEFLRDAIRTILQDRKDLRIAIAYELFTKKQISWGKAAEIIGSSIEETKELFEQRKI